MYQTTFATSSSPKTWLLALAVSALWAAAPAQAGEHDHHHHHHQPAVAAEPVWEEAAVAVPDVTVTDHDNRKRRLYGDLLKGRTVAINFMYTSCTTVCSPLTATLAQVRKDLVARGLGDVQVVSITVDPQTDTPKVLKSYAGKFDAGAGWSFVTATPAELRRIQAAFGVPQVSREAHTPIIFVTNEPTGKWTRVYGLASARSISEAVAEARAETQRAQGSGQPVGTAESAPHHHHHQHGHSHSPS